MSTHKIIHTDNFGGDYPDEKFVEGLPSMTWAQAMKISTAINETLNPDGRGSRYWKVVPQDYVLVGGFEP